MAFVFVNPNPKHNLVGDCTIRALSIEEPKRRDLPKTCGIPHNTA